MITANNTELKWFAAKMFNDRNYILKFFELEGVEVSRIADVPNLVFIHCSKSQIFQYRYDMYDKLYVYRNSERTEPEPVPENVMRTFILMAPFHNEPVIYLSVDSPSLFEGKPKRVTKGAFTGCEGVIKRIKGVRRLIVKISDHAAIATPYIPVENLQDII